MVFKGSLQPGWDFNWEPGNQVPAKSLSSLEIFSGTRISPRNPTVMDLLSVYFRPRQNMAIGVQPTPPTQPPHPKKTFRPLPDNLGS